MTKYGRKTRKFGSKVFKMRAWHETRAEIDRRAKTYRSEGLSVRITKTSRPVGYALWTNN